MEPIVVDGDTPTCSSFFVPQSFFCLIKPFADNASRFWRDTFSLRYATQPFSGPDVKMGNRLLWQRWRSMACYRKWLTPVRNYKRRTLVNFGLWRHLFHLFFFHFFFSLTHSLLPLSFNFHLCIRTKRLNEGQGSTHIWTLFNNTLFPVVASSKNDYGTFVNPAWCILM